MSAVKMKKFLMQKRRKLLALRKVKSKNIFPLFVSIPHSGVKIPPEADWLKIIPPSILMCDVDDFVDDLYRPALMEFQIPSVIFEWHRYVVDANRFSTDISNFTVERAEQVLQQMKKISDDGKSQDTIGSHKVKTKDGNSKNTIKALAKNKTVIGFKSTMKNKPDKKSPSDVHWYKTTKGDILIKKALSQKLHKDLIKKYFDPFHKKIQKQITTFKQAGNKNVYFLDLHSMPSQGLVFHRDPGKSRKQVVIGDNEGRSCSSDFKDLVFTAYKTAGFEVALNWPYKGGAITQSYGRPKLGQNSLQVELNRKLYMDEETKKKSPQYRRIQLQLKQAIAFIVQNYCPK